MMDSKRENWSVTLRPNNSLSREGFVAIMAILVFINLTSGIFFMSIGAWPVTGFMGLDVLIAWWAFRRNFSDARRYEQICIIGDVVALKRNPVRGSPTLFEFNRRWLRVELEFDEARELVGRLLFVYRGKLTEVGAFLGAEERQGLAKLLRQEMAA